MNTQLTTAPRSADEVMASLGNSRLDTTNRNTCILIEILSRTRWTPYELSILALEYPDFNTRMATGDKLAKNLWYKLFDFKQRYPGKVFDVWKKEWFVPGTAADPKVQRAYDIRKKSFGPIAKNGQKRLRGEPSLRSLIFDILSDKGPLEQRQLVFYIKRHPDYHGMYLDHLILRKAVNGALRNGSRKKRHRRLFKKYDDAQRLVKWGVIPGITPPPIRTKPQVRILSLIMSHRQLSMGWSIAELVEIAMRPDSGYALSPGATHESVAENIRRNLLRHKGIRFARMEETHGVRWRLNRRQSLKISLQDRLEAINLLAKGITLPHMVEILALKHPGLDWANIERLYSPSNGPFSIRSLEKASKDTIEAAKEKFITTNANLAKRLIRLHQDPCFIRKRLDALGRHFNDRNTKLLDMLADRDIEPISKSKKGWVQVGHKITPDQILLLKERGGIIANALSSLGPVEKQVVNLIFFNDYTAAKAAGSLESTEEEVNSILNDTLNKLAQNQQLKEIV